MVEVHTDDEDLLGGNSDAYAQAVAMAVDESDFESVVKRTAESLGFHVLGIEEAEPLEQRLGNGQITPLLEELRKAALASGQAAFGTFHSFPEDD